MTIAWNTPAGSLGSLTERVLVDIPISASSNSGPVTFSLLSGKFPRGLRLSTTVSHDSTVYTTSIIGSPTEVRKLTTSRFVIRATDGTDIEDRTFSFTVDGDDAPQWLTKEGFLNVGPNNAYYVLDNAYVNFQLEVRDPDIIAGDTLEFYLIAAGGELPPGLNLTKDGRIYGFTDPVFALEYNNNPTGAYDTGTFDTMPLDVANAGKSGFDSYLYDLETFDFSETTQAPRRLSRYYTFIVGVSDGLHEIRRLFRIWVVTEDFLKSDNTFIQVDTNLFQADGNMNRKPIWITPSDLGRVRANNFVTVFLDVYDPPSLDGTITYFKVTNPGTYTHNTTGETITDGRYELTGTLPVFPQTAIDLDISVFDDPSAWTVVVPETQSEFPPGMTLDTLTGEIAGRVPYQAAVTRSYQFTISAINFPSVLFEQNYSLKGAWNSSTNYVVGDAVRYGDFIWVCLQANRNRIPADGIYWDRGVSTKDRTFNIDVIGEIESSIVWITDSDLGAIPVNISSSLSVSAETTLYGGRTIYELSSGSLPPGLELIPNGLIQGKVKQFSDSNGSGLTRFYERTDSAEDSSTRSRSFNVTFDGDTSTFDRLFTFDIKAKDAINVAENIRTFTLFVETKNNLTFANLFAKAFQTKDKRLEWYNFITNSDIFKENEIYRYGDPAFGIQNELKMLLYAGIESRDASYFVQAMSRNHYRKQVRFGDVKYAVAKDPTTQQVIYEVVYVDVVDELEKNGKSIAKTVDLSDSINSPVLISYDSIKVDSDIPFVSDRDHQRVFPNSFKNMRARVKSIGERDREFLPLWMRSIQPNTYVEPGFVKSIVLCYLKPGYSDIVISRIKSSNFDFRSINFTIDRYLIDALGGELTNKYLAFSQRGEKLP